MALPSSELGRAAGSYGSGFGFARQLVGQHAPLCLLFGTGLFRCAGDLAHPQLLLHAHEVCRDPIGHRAGVRRPVLWLARQAVLGEQDQLGFRAAGVKPCHRLGQVAQGSLPVDLASLSAHERRLSGEDFAEDRAEGEHIGAAIDRLALAPRLLWRHVSRRAHHTARLREVRVGKDPTPSQSPSRAPSPCRPRRHRPHRLSTGLWPAPSP